MKKSIGFMALLAVGGYFAWRNRFEIRRFLESQGVDLPLDTSNASEAIRSTGAKVLGKVDQVTHPSMNHQETRKAI